MAKPIKFRVYVSSGLGSAGDFRWMMLWGQAMVQMDALLKPYKTKEAARKAAERFIRKLQESEVIFEHK